MKENITYEDFYNDEFDDEEFFEEVMSDVSVLEKVDKELLENESFIQMAILYNTDSFYYASEELKNDEDFIIETFEKAKGFFSAPFLEYISEDLKSDKSFFLEILKIDGTGIIYASDELRKEFLEDEELVKKIVDSVEEHGHDLMGGLEAMLECLPEDVFANKTFVMELLEHGIVADEEISAELWADKEVVEKIVDIRPSLIERASSKLKADNEIWNMIDHWEYEEVLEDFNKKFQKFSQESTENVPYNKIAKQALVNWIGMSEQEATETIEKSSFEQIESQVYAKGSIDYAIKELTEKFEITDKEGLTDYVISGMPVFIDKEKMSEFSTKESNGNTNYENVIQVLSAVHDGWVKDNEKKFMAREKKHQHMPIELIGWKETKADLLFVEPILESIGMQIDEEELEKAYNNRVKNFFLDNNIKNKEDLVNLISTGAEFYPALEGQEDVINAIQDEQFVKDIIIPQIEQNGIGNIEEKRKEIVDQITVKLIDDDLVKLSKEERDEMESNLDKENEKLILEKETLTEKEESIKRIREKMQKHRELQAEIAQIKRNEKSNEEYGE